jgi:hypothetical protein
MQTHRELQRIERQISDLEVQRGKNSAAVKEMRRALE